LQKRNNSRSTRKDTIMKSTQKLAVGFVAAAVLALAAGTAYAHPGMGGGMGHGMGWGGMGRMEPGYGPMGHGPMGYGAGAAQQLLTPEERTAFVEKMRNATSFEERQKLAAANRAEIQKRAKEKGITPPEGCGPAGFGPAPKS
jgi:hypothetical protein